MRWIPFAILVYVLILVQTTVGRVLMVERLAIGTVGPDLLAPLVVFIALYVRRATDAMIAACVLGFALDLTTAGGSGSDAVVGPMPILYALGARALFEVREAFFRQRILTKIFLTLSFCLFTHFLWVTVQSLLAHRVTAWSEYGLMLVQASAVSAYSAVLAPMLIWVFEKGQRWIVLIPAGRSRRLRR